MHILHTFANNDSVPYLSWFAERAYREGGIQYSFLLLHSERPAMMDEMQAMGFECRWIKYDDRRRKRGMLRALPLMWWHMIRHKPDIVHSHLFDDSLPGMLAACLARIKGRVATKQYTGYHWMHAPSVVFFDKLINRCSTDLIAVSEECRQFMIEKEGAPVEKISMVHHSIPTNSSTGQTPEIIERLRDRYGISGHYPVIGTVARFIAWKGYIHIVEAARSIVEDHPKALFLLCGMGEQQDHIRQLVHDAGLDEHVVFTGWVDRREIPSFYGVLDIYLHAAVLEPFGFVYAEAMMNAVPVVSTPTGAALDAIEDGQNGILVKERTGKALADGVERLMELNMQALGSAGKETALRMFPFDVMWKGTMKVYTQALARKR